jgi:hypothetical protein
MQQLRDRINDKLNAVWNEHTGQDSPMWCERVSNKTAYLNWHKYQDKEIKYTHFISNMVVIMAEFKDIEVVHSPLWEYSRTKLSKTIKQARNELHIQN